MQRIIASSAAVLLFFILLILYTKLIGPIQLSINSVTTTKQDTFDVSGEGKVFIKPDLAIIQVGVLADAATVQAAQDKLNSNINAVSNAIKALGIDAKDIKTQNYNIYPKKDFQVNERIIGYSASSNLEIIVRDINNANNVLDTATKSGANQIGGINFDVDDKTKAENEAREIAVADAKKKAEQAAQIAGFKLGKIVNYNENFGGGVPRLVSAYGLGASEDSQKTTQVEPGTNEVLINITLSYEIQ